MTTMVNMDQAVEWVTENGGTVLLVFAVILALHLLILAVQPYAFAAFMAWFTPKYSASMDGYKEELFRDMGQLRRAASTGGKGESRPLAILELGVGTGTNFKFYPEGSTVVGVEPNPNFAGYVAKSASESSGRVRLERTVVAKAENLRGLVDDSSVDAVVVTLVLCSVDDVGAVVGEAKRVLKPGGKFYYLEHVVADSGSWTKLLQYAVRAFWWYTLDGCCLMRSPWLSVDRAGFSTATCKRFMAPDWTFGPLRPHALGVATK